MKSTVAITTRAARELIEKAPQIVKESNSKYGFDLNKLKEGDILLTFGNDRTAQIIAGGTGGDFSHALIYLGNTSVHATQKSGVYTKNPQRLIFNDKSHLIALRPKSNISENIFLEIRNFAMSWVGGLYSIPEALIAKPLANSKIKSITETQYCSRLVAQSYEAAGIKIVKNPNYCSPNDINRSSVLEIVPNSIVLLNDSQIDFAQSKDPNEVIMLETIKWLNLVRHLVKNENEKINKISDVENLLLKRNYLDKEVCKIIRSTKYLDYVNIDRENNPWRYNKNLLLSYIKEKNYHLEEFCRGELIIVESEIKNRKINLFNPFYQIQLEYVKINRDIQSVLLKNAELRKKIIFELLYE